ncbi:hypothetical protein HMI01_11470 [Halolactibacillus miurensis]|uniref:Uncharacterized protein n=1 Tax=Halolactibacillus miurensis TaxID=306541 RepID=A0ABQ0VVH2_9BACI|nr:hypothetical protein HMI01_11470 [Halolactibacillus miurensis]
MFVIKNYMNKSVKKWRRHPNSATLDDVCDHGKQSFGGWEKFCLVEAPSALIAYHGQALLSSHSLGPRTQ